MRLQRTLSKKTVLTGLCLLSILAMVLPHRVSRWPGRALAPLLAPAGDAGVYLTTQFRGRVGRLAGGEPAGDDAAENLIHAMYQTIIDQQRRIDQLRYWRSELGDEFKCQLVDARVVGAESLPLRDRRLIDAGSQQGVAAGDIATTRRILHGRNFALPEHLAVLGANFLVGRIIDSAAHTAKLQLVTDPGFRIPAIVRRMVSPGQQRVIEVDVPDAGRELRTVTHDGRVKGAYMLDLPPIPVAAEGDGKSVVLRHVPAKHRIQRGDLLTSGYDSKLPFGMSIGVVARAEREKQAPQFVTVYVKPLADLSVLRDVYVVVPIARGQE